MASSVEIVSVPHCGSRFTADLLGTGTFKHAAYGIEDGLSGLIVVPLRDPVKVWRSWWVRGFHNRHIEHPFRMRWRMLDRLSRLRDLFCLPLDTSERNARLKELSERLGKPLETDWRPHSRRLMPDWVPPVPEIDLTEIYAMPVVSRFYECPITFPRGSKWPTSMGSIMDSR